MSSGRELIVRPPFPHTPILDFNKPNHHPLVAPHYYDLIYCLHGIRSIVEGIVFPAPRRIIPLGIHHLIIGPEGVNPFNNFDFRPGGTITLNDPRNQCLMLIKVCFCPELLQEIENNNQVLLHVNGSTRIPLIQTDYGLARIISSPDEEKVPPSFLLRLLQRELFQRQRSIKG